MKKQIRFPTLFAPAAQLQMGCCLAILVYLGFVWLFAQRTAGDRYAELFLSELLHGAATATLLSLGGGLLLDTELRAAQKTKK